MNDELIEMQRKMNAATNNQLDLLTYRLPLTTKRTFMQRIQLLILKLVRYTPDESWLQRALFRLYLRLLQRNHPIRKVDSK